MNLEILPSSVKVGFLSTVQGLYVGVSFSISLSIPFIATGQPFFKTIQSTYKTGRTFETEDVDSFVKEIEKLASDYKAYQDGFEQFLTDYSYANEMRRLVSIIK